MVSPSVSRTPTARPERTSTRSTSRSVSQTPPWSRISCTSASASFALPPRGTGIPPSCTATAITCVMKPDVAWSGPSPVWSTHGASRPCPRAASSSPSSACAAPPTQSGCHALKTSCRNPASVSSSVLIAPPNQSLRSSTQTRQPARASSAAHVSELTPLPTMTASKSATRELPELVVGDEAALARAELLDAGQQLRPPLLGHVETELLHLDPDRVEAALLAEHDCALGADELGRVRLDRRRVVGL